MDDVIFSSKKRKIILADSITERDLIKFIISQLAPNKIRKKNRARKASKTVYTRNVIPISSSVSYLPSGSNLDTKIADLKEEVRNTTTELEG